MINPTSYRSALRHPVGNALPLAFAVCGSLVTGGTQPESNMRLVRMALGISHLRFLALRQDLETQSSSLAALSTAYLASALSHRSIFASQTLWVRPVPTKLSRYVARSFPQAGQSVRRLDFCRLEVPIEVDKNCPHRYGTRVPELCANVII